jgi:structural maintenance of chromosome 3 (chondroitin sulfate proteoglycan 6)
LQLESRKDGIEIELNERLRRRHNELKTKIDALAEPEGGDSSSADNLEARTRELKALNNAIEALKKKVSGKEILPYGDMLTQRYVPCYKVWSTRQTS